MHLSCLTRGLAPRAVLTLALGLSGCTVSHGLRTMQRGMAMVDTASERASKQYVEAVEAIRRYCEVQTDPHSCEFQLHVDDASVQRVLSGAEEASDAYASIVDALGQLAGAWETLEPELRRVKESADRLGK